jgi:hypothetical protein
VKMHLLNIQIYHYILFYVLITLEHDFHNQKPFLKIRKILNIYVLLKFIPDLMNVINIFVFHLVLMEYQLIYKLNLFDLQYYLDLIERLNFYSKNFNYFIS